MGKFIIRRLLQMVVVLLGASFILFAALFIVPGDPVGSIGEKARDPAVVAQLREKYGLDDPLPVQYAHYVGRVVLHGDLGEDFAQRRSVNSVLGPKLVNTAKLASVAIVIDIFIGLFAGVISAVFRYSFWDVLVTFTTTLAIGFPTFVIGLLLQNVFALKLDVLPLFGQNNGLKSYVLPAFTLAIVDAALVARLMRGTMLEVLRADYIRTATAKGLSSSVVILKHALRNSIIPVVTYLGISFGSLLGGALITEVIFNWDGIGSALIRAIQTQNQPIITGVVTYGVAIFVVLNLIVDIAYAYLDPRIRLE